MKSNALKLFISISIYLLLAGNTWSATVYQCVNEANEISFSNQPCGESETLVKEHEIDENTNVISQDPAANKPGEDILEMNAPDTTAGENSPGAAVGGTTSGPGGNRASSGSGGGGGGASTGSNGPRTGGGTAAATTPSGAAPAPAGNTTDATSPATPAADASTTQSPSTTTSASSSINSDSGTSAAPASESQTSTMGVKAQATSVSTPLASAGVTVISGLNQDPNTSYIPSKIIINQLKKEITIQGELFGTGPNVILYDTFDNGIAGEAIPLKNSKNSLCLTKPYLPDVRGVAGPLVGCWTESPDNPPPVYYPLGHSGGLSFKTFYPEIEHAKQLRKAFDDDVTEIYISFWVKVPEGTFFPGKTKINNDPSAPGVFASESAWKFTWLTDGAIDSLVANVCLPTYSGGNSFGLGGNDNFVSGISKNIWWSWNNWMKLGIWLRANPTDPVTPGDVMFQATSLDKGFYEQYSQKPIFDADGPYPKKFRDIFFPGWMRSSSDNSTNPLYDDIYIATGPNAVSRVELSDSPTYGGSKTLAIQLPIDWNDNQIKVSLIDTGFEGGINGSYLYITDSNGNVNAEGYQLNLP